MSDAPQALTPAQLTLLRETLDNFDAWHGGPAQKARDARTIARLLLDHIAAPPTDAMIAAGANWITPPPAQTAEEVARRVYLAMQKAAHDG